LSGLGAGFGLLVLQLPNLVAMLLGAVVGVIVGLAPGLSSRSALLVALPFLLSIEPTAAAIFLIAMHAASQISGTVPAALFGVPTSASEAASVVDGYPMMRRGEGARLYGAIIASSLVGLVLGALVLLVAGPVFSAIMLYVGSPEIAALSLCGLVAVAAVSTSGLAPGIALGAAGVLTSTIGLHAASGLDRFTFGNAYLDQGVAAPAIIAGVMALPELLRVAQEQGKGSVRITYAGIFQGALEPFRHAALVIRSTVIGLLVGITPGLGSSVAAWVSYGGATSTSRPAVPFGQGAVEGVVAPETGSGAKEGGALIPTLLLGIPGSSGMAILLGAFAVLGIRVGPTMVSQHPDFLAMIAYCVALAALAGFLLSFFAAPAMIRLASLPRRIVTVFALAGATISTFYSNPTAATLIELLVFALFGLLLARARLARPPFIIGFVVGPVFESALLRSQQVFGLSALTRPGVVVIVVLAVMIAAYLMLQGRGRTKRPDKVRLPAEAGWALAALVVVFGITIWLASGYGTIDAFLPLLAAGVGMAAALISLAFLYGRKAAAATGPRPEPALTALFVASSLLALWVGPAALLGPIVYLLLPALSRFGARPSAH
jgi:TctA family transporter